MLPSVDPLSTTAKVNPIFDQMRETVCQIRAFIPHRQDCHNTHLSYILETARMHNLRSQGLLRSVPHSVSSQRRHGLFLESQ